MRHLLMAALILFVLSVVTSFVESRYAPAPLPRKALPEPQPWPVGEWHDTQQPADYRLWLTPDGGYREDWCGTPYTGAWHLTPDGACVLCARDGSPVWPTYTFRITADDGGLRMHTYGRTFRRAK